MLRQLAARQPLHYPLLLDSAGNTLVDPTAVLSGNTITADASVISFVAANNLPGNGLVIGPATLAQLANANVIILQSRGAIDFVGDVAGLTICS